MFLYNAMWAWNVSASIPDGTVLHAVGCPRENAESRGFPDSRRSYTLFDPNSCLWGLDGDNCARAVECIESYPWVPDAPARVALSQMSDEDIASVLSISAEWQVSQGVSRVILPTPLIADPSSNIDQFLRWMDLGIGVAQGLGISPLMTVGLSDVAIGAHLSTVLDQVTARDEVAGVYAFVETSRSSSAVAVSQEVARTLLMMSYFVGSQLGREVVVNFADSFGLACVAVGASAFAGGYEQKSRRLDFENFVEREGGGPFPKFFSMSTASYYRPERDMQRIRDERLLRLLVQDRTRPSESLFAALESGANVADLPDWRESRNNVSAARAHLIECMCNATATLNGMSSDSERAQWVLAWLQNAERDAAYLDSRFESAPLDDDGRHTRVWREAFELFVEEYGLLR